MCGEFCAISRLAQAVQKANGLCQKLIGKGKLGLPPNQIPERILTKPTIYYYIMGDDHTCKYLHIGFQLNLWPIFNLKTHLWKL